MFYTVLESLLLPQIDRPICTVLHISVCVCVNVCVNIHIVLFRLFCYCFSKHTCGTCKTLMDALNFGG